MNEPRIPPFPVNHANRVWHDLLNICPFVIFARLTLGVIIYSIVMPFLTGVPGDGILASMVKTL